MLTDKGCPLLWVPSWLLWLIELAAKPCGSKARKVASALRRVSKVRFGVDIFTTGSRWTGPLVTFGLTCAVFALAIYAMGMVPYFLYLAGMS